MSKWSLTQQIDEKRTRKTTDDSKMCRLLQTVPYKKPHVNQCGTRVSRRKDGCDESHNITKSNILFDRQTADMRMWWHNSCGFPRMTPTSTCCSCLGATMSFNYVARNKTVNKPSSRTDLIVFFLVFFFVLIILRHLKKWAFFWLLQNVRLGQIDFGK